MMLLDLLLNSVAPGICSDLAQECLSLEIHDLRLDSRRVRPGDLFIAIPGHKLDGTQFVSQAVLNGASAVITENSPAARKTLAQALAGASVPVIFVQDVRRFAAVCAKVFYRDATARLLSFGVTGTNGKTSVSWIVAELLALAGFPTAHVGTLGARIVNGGLSAPFVDLGTTTPDAVWLQSFLADSETRGVRALAMEASSHGLVQSRTTGVEWDCALFTNLTRDHLDFHGSLENYGQAKLKLFIDELASSQKPRKSAVLNVDDPFSAIIREALKGEKGIDVLTYSDSLNTGADCFPYQVEADRLGSRIEAMLCGERLHLETRLVGGYNVSNLLCALLAVSTVIEPRRAAALVPQVSPVPGRLELAACAEISVFIDYAHTPDALLRAHLSLREIAQGGRVLTVFGCGGDRDRGKRPLMGQVVAEQADFAVVTSDNPRSEEPQAIIDEILPGLQRGARAGFRFEVQSDRRAAILSVIRQARPGDLVLIAGKGHESYQETCGVKHPFSDLLVARQGLTEAGLI